jgi:hypothetical protein
VSPIRRDPFDSDVLGKRCGIVDGPLGLLTIEKLQHWDHVRYAIGMNATPSYAFEDVRRLENLGFHLASVRGTFEGTAMAMGSYDQARTPTDDEAERICVSASALFLHSRFNTDPFYLPEDMRKIHAVWCVRLLNEDRLYVAGPIGAPRGFVGFARSGAGEARLDIELIGSLDNLQGSGRHTLCALVVEERCHHVRAKTQLSNLAAVGLYHALGMKLTKTEAIMTWSRS